jgi:NhaP-type Na+/H+ or K+/H+ antiporter
MDLSLHLEPAAVAYALAGAGALLAAVLPRLVSGRAFNLPLGFLLGGVAVFLLPLGLPEPDPVKHQVLVEHMTELVVIVSLMGAGLALDRPFGLRRWRSTWRLLVVAMPITIVGVMLVGHVVAGLPVAVALLLGAVLAPTDPVLAADVQVGEPTIETEDEDDHQGEDEVRFALTSEAGLNDGAAFPFVHLAIVLIAATAAGTSADIGGWVLSKVVWATAAGIVVGLLIGRLLARWFFRAERESLRLSEQADGFVALAVTFLAYGVAEVIGGYGFVAVFVAACAMRAAERSSQYHQVLHGFTEQVERLLTAWVLLLLGGAVATGLLSALGWRDALVGLALVVVIRPAAAWAAQIGTQAGRWERWVVAVYGIRGIGSLYYLAYAAGHAELPAERLWSIVGFTVVLSVVAHGLTATPVMSRLDRARERRADARTPGDPSVKDVADEHV